MTTPSLRDAQVAKLIKENERLWIALRFAAAGFAIIANDKTATEHSRSFAKDNFKQAKSALAEERGE